MVTKSDLPSDPGIIAGAYDEYGRFKPDPTVIEPPIGYFKSKSIAEQIRDMVRSEALRQAAEVSGAETFEEADDFDVQDDFDPSSPYEENFDPTPVSELRRRLAEAEAAEAAAAALPPSQPLPMAGRPSPAGPAQPVSGQASPSGSDS